MLGILVIIVIWSAVCVYIYISPGTIVQDVHEYRCQNHGCTYLLEIGADDWGNTYLCIKDFYNRFL